MKWLCDHFCPLWAKIYFTFWVLTLGECSGNILNDWKSIFGIGSEEVRGNSVVMFSFLILKNCLQKILKVKYVWRKKEYDKRVLLRAKENNHTKLFVLHNCL